MARAFLFPVAAFLLFYSSAAQVPKEFTELAMTAGGGRNIWNASASISQHCTMGPARRLEFFAGIRCGEVASNAHPEPYIWAMEKLFVHEPMYITSGNLFAGLQVRILRNIGLGASTELVGFSSGSAAGATYLLTIRNTDLGMYDYYAATATCRPLRKNWGTLAGNIGTACSEIFLSYDVDTKWRLKAGIVNQSTGYRITFYTSFGKNSFDAQQSSMMGFIRLTYQLWQMK